MMEAHHWLAYYYHAILTKTHTGEEALAYLHQRGFTDETIDTFQIGYAPSEWDMAANFLAKQQFSLELLQKAGLFSKRAFDGKYFDRFRHRIMFPIRDPRGRPMAFGGRSLGDDEPKYLNSPETDIFHKGRTLFGYDIARSAIREKRQAILLEGYVDVISVQQAGLQHAVASLGTSLTEEQAYMLRRQAQTVTICYDADAAGTRAALRAADILESVDCYVKIALMPDGLDPDDYIRDYGVDRFRMDVIGTSQTVTAFKLQYYRKDKNLQDESEQMRYIDEVLPVIAGLGKAVERDHYLRQLADEFSLSLDALKKQQFQVYKRQQAKKQQHKQEQVQAQKHVMKKSLLPAHQTAERTLLAYMLSDQQIAEKVQAALPNAFYTDAFDAIAVHLYTFYAEGHTPDISLFMQKLPDQSLVQTVSEIAMIPLNEDVSDEEITDYINRIIDYPKWLEIDALQKEQKAAEAGEQTEEAARLANKIIEKRRELKRAVQ